MTTKFAAGLGSGTDRQQGSAPAKAVRISRSLPGRAEIAAILVTITGMIIQIASGVKYPTVPPGIVILTATALLLALVPWPGVRVLGVLAPLLILVGGVVSSTGRTNIGHPSQVGPFAGTLIQFAGLAAAVALGLAALAEWRTARTRGAA